jgi:putative endonuclease
MIREAWQMPPWGGMTGSDLSFRFVPVIPSDNERIRSANTMARNLQRKSVRHIYNAKVVTCYCVSTQLLFLSSYYFYITTNPNRTVLYCGVTNNLPQRMVEHYLNRGNTKTFAGKYYCYFLIYYEEFMYVNDAIAREKEVKKWRREKKENLIRSFNKEWKFLNFELFDTWPPQEMFHRKDI